MSSNTTPATPPSTRLALAALCLAMLMPSLDTSIANAALPTLAQAFGASFAQVQWIVLAYLLAITSLIVSVGRLGDIFSRKRLLLLGIALFTAASLLCAIAPTLPLLIAARAAQGIGAAIMLALTIAMVTHTVPKSATGSAMGLIGAMSAIGTTLGPSLGGVLTSALGWRWIFLINLPVGSLTLLLAHRHLPLDAPSQNPTSPRPSFDYPGTLLLAATLAAYALAMTLGKSSLTLALLALALATALLFLFTQSRSSHPLVPLSLFEDRPIAAGLATSALVSTVMMATLVVGPFYLARALSLSPAAVGLLLSIGPLVAALTAIPAGALVDRFGARPISALGLTAITTGSLLLATLPMALGVPGYLAPITLITAGYAFFQSANNTAILTTAPAHRRGVISGMLTLSRNLGLITGASAMGALFAFAAHTSDISSAPPQSIATGMHTTFAAAAFLTTLALAITLSAHRALSPFTPASALPSQTPGSPP